MPMRSKLDYFVLQVGVDRAGSTILVSVQQNETFINKEKGGGGKRLQMQSDSKRHIAATEHLERMSVEHPTVNIQKL